jgi:hypothetical protein
LLRTLDDRLPHFPPPVGAVHTPRRRAQCPFAVSKLVEAEERVVADALEVAVVGGTFLVTVYGALGAVHVQDNPPVGLVSA